MNLFPVRMDEKWVASASLMRVRVPLGRAERSTCALGHARGVFGVAVHREQARLRDETKASASALAAVAPVRRAYFATGKLRARGSGGLARAELGMALVGLVRAVVLAAYDASGLRRRRDGHSTQRACDPQGRLTDPAEEPAPRHAHVAGQTFRQPTDSLEHR
jgi:hypothetical protein